MTKAPERIWAMAPHIGEYYADPPVTLDDKLYLNEYISAETLAADPLKFIDVPDLVWDKHPDDLEWYSVLPEIDHIERGYMILFSHSYGGYMLYDGFSSRRRKLKLCATEAIAEAAANAHHRAMIAQAITGVKT